MSELELLQQENDKLLNKIIEKDKEILKLINEINKELANGTN